MNRTLVACGVLVAVGIAAARQPGRPDREGRPGPWDNDVLVYSVGRDGTVAKLATFERSGVPSLARLADGRLIAATQHFPANDTLVPLPDGRVRLYFTSVNGRTFAEHRPAIYSAVSKDGLAYEVEPGVRFGVEGRPVIDCAVALHDGVFHLFAPDNGAGGPPGPQAPPRRPEDRPRDGVGYHATSTDGLAFTRQPDVTIDGRRHWLGTAVSDGGVIRFVGPGEGGLWAAESRDGKEWKRLPNVVGVRGADPGAVRLKDGGWLYVATGPPRPGTPSDRNRPANPKRPPGGVEPL